MYRRLLHACASPAHRGRWLALLALMLVVISWLALSPAPPRVASTGWDKANHALAFAALAFAAVWAHWPSPRQWHWLAAALLAYGGAIEVAQGLLPPRSADWADLLADGAGIALGLTLAWPIAFAAARRR